MNKEQAQNNINEIGKKCKLATRTVYIAQILVIGALLVAAVGVWHTLSMVIVTCVLLAALVVFGFITVRQYMNFFRINVYYSGICLFWVVALNCVVYATLYRAGSFVAWDFYLSIAIQVALFIVIFVTFSTFADGSKPAIWITVIMAVATVVSLILSRFLAFIPIHDSDMSVIFPTILINILSILFALGAAVFAACLYLMRKYDVEYKPEWQSVDDFINETRTAKNTFQARSVISLYNVYCFEYKSYLLFIYAKDMTGKLCKLLVYDGDTLILEEKYKDIDELFEQAEIDNNKLTEIWDSVQPL